MVRLLILLIIISSCAQKGQEDVKIKTSGIFDPISFWHKNDPVESVIDLGEYVRGSVAVINYLQIKNNSRFPIAEIDLVFIEKDKDYYDFEMVNNEANFPGRTGDCERSLQPDESCLIAIQFKSNASGNFRQKFLVSYKNIVTGAISDRELEFVILSGTPASLTFTNDKSNYVFGTPVTTAQIPVVERIDPDSYQEEIEIKNAGELTARDISISYPITETCSSMLDRSNPVSCEENTQQSGTYVLSNIDCPSFPGPFNLKNNESCKVKVDYRPKNNLEYLPAVTNNDIAEEMQIVQYDALLVFNYIQDPLLNSGNLSAFFTSTSALIEAKLKTPANFKIEFPNTIGGNRRVLPFQVNNEGFQKGGILSFNFSKDGIVVANCKKSQMNSSFLECFSENGQILLDRFEMPYTIKDLNSCISANSESLTYIETESSCFFELIFQPTESLTDRYSSGEINQLELEYNYDISVVYDSQWKGVFTERESVLFPVKGKGVVGAIIEIESIAVDEDTKSFGIPQIVNGVKIYKANIGRQAVYAHQVVTLDDALDYTITLKNSGGPGSIGKIVTAIDGNGTLIPFASSPAVNLGIHDDKFYQNFVMATSCSQMAKDASCVITGKLLITNKLTPDKWPDNFYDIQNGSEETSYKKFSINYQSGSTYLDSNLDETLTNPETQPYELEAQVFGKMVTRAVLSRVSNFNTNFHPIFKPVEQLVDDGVNYRLYQVRNIGTGDPSFMRLTDFTFHKDVFPVSLELDRSLVKIVPFSEITTSHGIDLSALDMPDCMEYFDLEDKYNSLIGTTYPVSYDVTNLLTRKNDLIPLQTMIRCSFLVKFDGKANLATSFNQSIITAFHSLGGFLNGNESYYPQKSNIEANPRFIIEYFDNDKAPLNDIDRPNFNSNEQSDLYDAFGTARYINRRKLGEGVGNLVFGNEIPLAKIIKFKNSGSLALDNVSNSYSGLSFKYGGSTDDPLLAGTNLSSLLFSPIYWFRDGGNGSVTNVNEAYVSNVLPPLKPTRRFIKNYLDTYTPVNPSDAVVYLGSFPKRSENYVVNFTINNLGSTDLKILSTQILDPMVSNPFSIVSGAIPTSNWGTLTLDQQNTISTIQPCLSNCTSGFSASRQLSVSFDSNNSGEFEKILRITYETQRVDEDEPWLDSLDPLTSKTQRTFDIRIQASSFDESNINVPGVKLTYQEFNVTQPVDINGNILDPEAELVAGVLPIAPNGLSFGINESSLNEDTISMTSIIQISKDLNPDGSLKFGNSIDPKLIFNKRRIIFKNTKNLPFTTRWSFKAVESATSLSSTLTPIEPKKDFAWEGTCLDRSTLPLSGINEYELSLDEDGEEGDSCYLDITFQARDSGSQDIRLNLHYELAQNHWVNKHINIKLISQSQPSLSANLSPVNVTGGLQPYLISMGTLNYVAPHLVYDADSGEPFIKFTRIVNISNNSVLRASLLATYHDWQRELNTFTNLESVPAPETYDGDGFTFIKKVFHKKFDNALENDLKRPKIFAESTRDCLVGPNIPEVNNLFHAYKGFSKDDNNCRLRLTRYYPLAYMYRVIRNTDAVIANDNIIDLKYYSYQRFVSSTSLKFYFEGTFGAPTVTGMLTASNKYYFDQYTNSQGNAGFKWNPMEVENPALGAIVGYRVFYHKNSSFVGQGFQISPVNATTKDLKGGVNYNLNPFVAFANEFGNDITARQGAYYYFSVAAIRYSPFYKYVLKTQNPSHPDALPTLATSFDTYFNQVMPTIEGHYTSRSNLTALELIIPPFGKEYIPSQNIVLDRSLSSFSLNTSHGMSFDQAMQYCGQDSITILKGSQTRFMSGQLIDQTRWNLITDPVLGPTLNHNSYNPEHFAHWINKMEVIPTQVALYGLPDNEAFKDGEMYANLKMWYIKDQVDNQICHECPVPVLRGRNIAYDGTLSWGWTGFINRQLPFGQARCFYSITP